MEKSVSFRVGQLVTVDNCGTMLDGIIESVGSEMCQVWTHRGVFSFHYCKIRHMEIDSIKVVDRFAKL